MTITTRALFPSPVWTTVLDNHVALNASLLQHVLALRENDPAGVVNTNVAGWQSPNTIQLLSQFKDINERIVAVCQQIGIASGFATDTEYRYQAWVNVNPPGGSNNPHIHPNCQLSGVYYVAAPSGCGALFFRDPRIASLMAPAPLRQPGEFTATEAAMGAEPGRLYVFPAWLEHGVKPNRAQTDRVSISFNIQVVPRPGSGR